MEHNLFPNKKVNIFMDSLIQCIFIETHWSRMLLEEYNNLYLCF
jgi:hypothetical protein